ncbi:hypothetical protein NZ698_11630 [Chryseobacterium sp. PBS4-4]|uniref:Uncharacterized protein n=1 Tax=Chryseobacterium edaphi TaxID=2976532 RepID=A0ABT2W6N7_9FLAO|nr:hypothetical protein [Chryseobacterium edaphi]MCU7617851.1 hypothetical protein [Chryseobacterium edaphi]
MTKKHLKWLVAIIFSSLTIQSCIRDHAMSEDEKSQERAKFAAFANAKKLQQKTTGGDLIYQEGFRYLYKRYYDLHPEDTLQLGNNTAKPDFSKASQVFTGSDGSQTVLFPVVLNNTVVKVLAANINSDEDYIQFYNANSGDYVIDKAKDAFSQSYLQHKIDKTYKKTIGETEIEEVVINWPANIPSYVEIRIPPGRSGECDDLSDYQNNGCGGPPPSSCPPYQNCDNSSLGGNGIAQDSTKTPCEKIAAIGKNTKTKNLLTTLKIKSTQTDPATGKYRETGYTLTENGGNLSEEEFLGELGKNEMKFSVGSPINGYIHNHNPTGFSIFTPFDLASFSYMQMRGRIKDPSTFIFGVITPGNSTTQGTQYMLVIDDLAAFSLFINEYLNADQNYVDWLYHSSGVKHGNSASQNEDGFLQFMWNYSSGLKLLKGDPSLNNWTMIERGASFGQKITTPCN